MTDDLSLNIYYHNCITVTDNMVEVTSLEITMKWAEMRTRNNADKIQAYFKY